MTTANEGTCILVPFLWPADGEGMHLADHSRLPLHAAATRVILCVARVDAGPIFLAISSLLTGQKRCRRAYQQNCVSLREVLAQLVRCAG